MNKLYILGALLLSSAEGLKLTLGSAVSTLTAGVQIPFGSFTYTVSGDCYSAATATTLGMNNKYYQYYTFDISAGSKSFATTSPSIESASSHVYIYNACSHTHLYNWMAVPAMGTAAI